MTVPATSDEPMSILVDANTTFMAGLLDRRLKSAAAEAEKKPWVSTRGLG